MGTRVWWLVTLLCFTEISDGPMWQFLKRRSVVKEGNLGPRHTDNSDEVSGKESQASDRFHCTSITMDKKVLFLQWTLHGPVIQIFLLHCASSVANDLQMQE
jgi:hypothetical protein